MGIALSDLIEQIGLSVQNANAAIEQMAAAVYLGQSFTRVNNNQPDLEEFTPISYTINLPSPEGQKKINVPVTALMNHTSLKLEQVDVKLKFSIEECEKDSITVSAVSSDEPDNSNQNELSLQFKNTPSAEGMARVDHHYIQTL